MFASTLTFIGSVTPILFESGIPVFIDSDRTSWNMDPELLREALEACSKRGGVNGNKIITTSGGGMPASDDESFIEQARFLSQQARDPAPHYEHTQIGYNYRMSNIVAAIGLGQLQVLDERVAQKRRIFDFYKEALGDLPGIEFMPEAAHSRSTRWLTVILITPETFGADREAIHLALEAENIESRPIWKPMHAQPVFGAARRTATSHPCRSVGGKVAEDLFARGLCLPSGTQMTDSDLNRIVEVIRRSRGK